MISVILPTLNAAAHLPRSLPPLVEGMMAGLVREVIVVDGGSEDATCAMAEAAGARVITAPRGRALQLIAGAAAARGDWLLFLHADTALAPGWAGAAAAFLARADPGAAAFTFAFDEDSAAANRVAFFARLRARLWKLPYGDQGLLIARAHYQGLGGYRPLALMEDVDMVRRIGPKRLTILPHHAVTSAEKYRRDGFQRRAWRNLWLVGRYLLGADPAVLARAYE